MEKRNQYDERCTRCGQPVAAGTGWLRTRRDHDAGTVAHSVVHEKCPPGEDVPRDVPVWVVYGEGITPAGNRTDGVRIVVGARPDDDNAIPMNYAAERANV